MATEKTCLELRKRQSTHFANVRLRHSKALRFLNGLAQSQFFSLCSFFLGWCSHPVSVLHVGSQQLPSPSSPCTQQLWMRRRKSKRGVSICLFYSPQAADFKQTNMGLNMHFQSVSLHLYVQILWQTLHCCICFPRWHGTAARDPLKIRGQISRRLALSSPWIKYIHS